MYAECMFNHLGTQSKFSGAQGGASNCVFCYACLLVLGFPSASFARCNIVFSSDRVICMNFEDVELS